MSPLTFIIVVAVVIVAIFLAKSNYPRS